MLSRLDELKEWRAGLPDHEAVGVVVGSFDILHPGNLQALEAADGAATHVLILLRPDDAKCHSAEQRAAFLLGVRGVDRVAQLSPVEIAELLDAQDYHMAAIAEGPSDDFVETITSRTLAVGTLPPPACASADAVVDAIREGRTPVESPEPGLRVNVSPAGRCVTVNGCFDILHLGHLDLLERAKAMGDHLTVLINSDVSVQRYKGESRPVMPQSFRARALRALRAVDAVEIFDDDNPLALLESLKPEVHVKGGSFEESRVADERALLESWGGRVEMCPLLENFSTSRIIEIAAG